MLIILDKPSGPTSFDLIRKLKKIYPWEKIGHAGTLDPLATGVMLIAIGNDTKKLGTLTELDKVYRTTIDLTLATDTWDSDRWKRESRITANHTWNFSLPDHATPWAYLWWYEHLIHMTPEIPTQEIIDTALQAFVGTHPQPLTPFSAKKLKGKKLYEYARAGDPVHIHMPMQVHRATLLVYEFPFVTVEFNVWSGTYIRSLAYELGKRVGWAGALTQLRRVSVGMYGFAE